MEEWRIVAKRETISWFPGRCKRTKLGFRSQSDDRTNCFVEVSPFYDYKGKFDIFFGFNIRFQIRQNCCLQIFGNHFLITAFMNKYQNQILFSTPLTENIFDRL
jgi:hypothetical protein